MADLNYLNPASFQPGNDFKASGPLGGVVWGQQQDDYRQMMDQQMYLQELAKRRALVETQQQESDVPLLNLQRQGKIQSLQGSMPFLGQQAAGAAQTDIAGNDYKRDVTFGPESKKLDLLKMSEGVDEIKQKNLLTSVAHAGRIASEGMEIAKTQGQLAAQQYVQQQIERARAANIDIPPQVSNPQTWVGLRQAGIQSVQHLQDMEKVKQQGANTERVAQITAGGHVQAAQISADARRDVERPLNAQQMFGKIAMKPEDKRTPEENQFIKGYVAEKWADKAANLMMEAAMNKGPDGKARQLDLTDIRDQFFKDHGVSVGQEKNNAKVSSFATVAEAVKAGKQPGDSVIINGVQGKLK